MPGMKQFNHLAYPLGTVYLHAALLLSVLLLANTTRLQAQADTEFWFVAPEVWAGHGDSPTQLRFATYGQPAIVTVNQPANPAFPVQTLNIPANSAQSLNLGPWLN